MAGPIKVLIIDDSAVVRQALSEILAADAMIRVVGVAADPLIAEQKMAKERPDVMTLDVEMPRMDGLTFLKKVMAQNPIPVVMCSSLTLRGADTTIKALQYGAVDIISKPKYGARQHLEESRIMICDAVKAAARARVRRLASLVSEPQPKFSADVILDRPRQPERLQTTEKVVAVGASTGGTEALRIFLQDLSYDSPGVVIVQHMPQHFTEAFARRLNGICKVDVKEAADGDTVLPGRVLIAPGNRHMLLKRSGARYYVQIKDGPLVCRHRPSVDVLFRSVARYAGQNAIGVIMTGMGDDGARGMFEMKQAGAMTFAQNEETCVVFGMPQEAIRAGGVDKVLPLEKIAATVISAYRNQAKTFSPLQPDKPTAV